MRRSFATTILAVMFLTLIIVKCKSGADTSDTIKAQKVAIAQIYSSNERLHYAFYSDSIIKNVSSMTFDQSGGKVVSFHTSGKMKNVSFFNKDGKKVGDETKFDLNGNMTEHLFWLNENDLLFHLTFNEKKIKRIDGKPWYINGPEKVMLNDTALYYIATPLIPG